MARIVFLISFFVSCNFLDARTVVLSAKSFCAVSMEEEGIDSHILRLADFEKLIFVNISRIDGYFDFADAEELAGLKEAIRKFYYRFGVLIGLSNSSDAEKVKWFRMAQNFLSDSIELHNRILKGRFDFPGYEKQYGIDAEYILGMEEPSPENILQLLSATRVYLTYRARYILMNNKDLFLSGYKSPRDLSLAQKKFWKSLIEDLREEFSYSFWRFADLSVRSVKE